MPTTLKETARSPAAAIVAGSSRLMRKSTPEREALEAQTTIKEEEAGAPLRSSTASSVPGPLIWRCKQ